MKTRRTLAALTLAVATAWAGAATAHAGAPGDLGDGNGDGLADVWATIPDGRYSAASTANGKTEFYAKKAGQDYLVAGRTPLRDSMGLGAADAMVALPDMTGDRRADAMVRFGSHLYLYVNDGTGKLVRNVEIGHGWGTMDTVIYAGHLNGDSQRYLLARNSADQGLYAYKLLGGGSVSTVGKVGQNWGGMKFLLSPGQMVGDGKSDLVGITKTGDMICYRGTGGGKVSSVGQCGRGWTGFQTAFVPGDMTGDGRPDLVGVRYVTHPNGHCDTSGTICDPVEPLTTNDLSSIPQQYRTEYELAPAGSSSKYRLKGEFRGPMYLYANQGNATWGSKRMIGHDMFQFKVIA